MSSAEAINYTCLYPLQNENLNFRYSLVNMTLSFFAIQTSLQSEIFARTSWAPVEYKTAGETVSL